MNDNFYVAVSCGYKDSQGKKRYFVGLIKNPKSDYLDMQLVRTRDFEMRSERSRATLRKWGVLMHPTRLNARNFINDIKRQFKNKNAFVVWIDKMLEKYQGATEDQLLSAHHEVLIGEVIV